MTMGLAIARLGWTTRLKWHRAKRNRSDVPFTATRIREGIALGASIEVDLNPHADDGFVVLHDETLDRETTGTGSVGSATEADLRRLFMRGEDGCPTVEPVMVLDDLVELAATANGRSPCLVQLDLKVGASALRPATIDHFSRLLNPVGPRFVLSGGDPSAVRVLSDATSRLRIGFDPCHDNARLMLLSDAGEKSFVADAVAAMPNAEIIYLNWRLVVDSLRNGGDVVRRFHDAGKEIDAYTLDLATEGIDDILPLLLEAKVDQITTNEPVALERRAQVLGLVAEARSASGSQTRSESSAR